MILGEGLILSDFREQSFCCPYGPCYNEFIKPTKRFLIDNTLSKKACYAAN